MNYCIYALMSWVDVIKHPYHRLRSIYFWYQFAPDWWLSEHSSKNLSCVVNRPDEWVYDKELGWINDIPF